MARRYNANVHRGVHFLSTQATTAFEEARSKVAGLINAPAEELVFTKNATEALNLVAFSWSQASLQPGDEVCPAPQPHQDYSLVRGQADPSDLRHTLPHTPMKLYRQPRMLRKPSRQRAPLPSFHRQTTPFISDETFHIRTSPRQAYATPPPFCPCTGA